MPKRVSMRLPSKVGNVPVTVIGEITREKKVVLIEENGREKALSPMGWDPFR
jgi:hydrogenase maturation factor